MLAIALGGVNAACGAAARRAPSSDPAQWVSYLGNPRHATSANEHLAAELVPSWHVSIGKAASGPPAIGDEVVVILGFNRALQLFDRQSGARAWRVRLNTAGVGGPLLAGDRIYAATGGREGRVYALRLANGSRIWRRDIGAVSPPIATATDRVLAVTETGRVVGLDATDGEVVWRQRLGGPVRAGVMVVGTRAIVATDDSIFVLAPADGEILTRASLPGALIAPPAAVGDTLILASAGGFIAAMSVPDLEMLWRVELDDPVFASPAVARDTIVVVTLTGKLWHIPVADPESRRVLDLEAPVRAAPAPIANGVLVGTIQGEVLFVPAGGGSAVTRVRVEGPIEQQPIVRDGTLFVVDGVGGMHAWK